MTIRNKDGSVFKLQGPNSIAKDQNNWSDEKLVLHNMNWKVVEIEDEIDEIEEMVDEIDEIEEAVEEIEEAVEEIEDEVVEEAEVIKEVSEPIKKQEKPKIEQKPKPKLKNTVDVWCLPAVYEEGKIKYLNKVMFEAIIVTNTGLQMVYWTNIEFSKKGSIIFPYKNSEGRTYGEFKWWKVCKVIGPDEDKRLVESGGFLYACVPSEITPNFND